MRPKVGAVGVSVLLAATVVLAGCSLFPENAASPEPASGPSSAAPAKEAAAEQQKPVETVSAAQEFSNKLTGSLEKLASNTKAPNREQMMAAVLEAGATKESAEISVDITPTGLAVDAIEAASPVADQCVIGQVRDGNVTVTILPVLASGRCFVGDVH